MEDTPVGSIPLDAFIALLPADLKSDGDAAWGSDSLICLRVDARWRCGATAALGDGYPMVARVGAPVRGANGIGAAIEVSRCDGGSELNECIYTLAVLAFDGDAWSLAGSLPLDVTIDEHLRERDDDDLGAKVLGSTHAHRRRYAVETPSCVRFTSLERTAESYFYHFRDDRPDVHKRRALPPDRGLAPAPSELPRVVGELDAYADPADLDGVWQLRGERWSPVERCDP